MNDPIANPLGPLSERHARRADYRQAYEIAEKIIDDTIARGVEDGTIASGLMGPGTRPGLEDRLEATIRLAEWLQGDNPVIRAVEKAEELVADQRAVFGLDDPLAGYGLVPGAQAIAHRNALRHLATVANDVFATFDPSLTDMVFHDADPLGYLDEPDNPEDQARIRGTVSAMRALNEAVDQAYAALDWPRYPEPEGT